MFSDEETLLNTVNELYTSNNSIIGMYYSNIIEGRVTYILVLINSTCCADYKIKINR